MGWKMIAFLPFLALILISECQAQQNAFPTIPDHLIECYKNTSIFHRANRLPMTIGTFISLVRKIETSQSGRNLDAREIANSLQGFLRLDGIEPSPVSTGDSSIVPYAPMGDEYFKYRLLILRLLSKPNQPNYSFLTESLTTQEICNLHFMLSYSVDGSRRLDENCQNTQQELYSGRRRWRREDDNRESEEDEKKVEQLPPDILEEMQNSKPAETEKKSQFIVGTQDLLSSQGPYSERRIKSQTGKRMTGQPILNVERSSCPIENGVVWTPYGSVALGTVVAGIAAGLSRQNIPPTQMGLTQQQLPPQLANARIDNVWASTLIGDISDVILSVGLLPDGLQRALGLKGGWNNTVFPQWYLLEKDEPKYLSDAQLRGGLDGLWLGQNVKAWVDRSVPPRLSQILDSYYLGSGYLDANIRACNRRNSFSSFAPSDTLSQQLELYSMVMQVQRVNTATITDFSSIVPTVVSALQSYVPNFDSQSVCNSGNYQVPTTTSMDYMLNIAVVIDTAWQPLDLQNMLSILINQEVLASPFQANTTIICGSDGNRLYQGNDLVSFYRNFTTRMCPPGIDLTPSLYAVETIFRGMYAVEKETNKITPGSMAVLLLPQTPSSMKNATASVESRKRINVTMPDVKFIGASNGPKDQFRGLVDNVDEDAFTIQNSVPNDPQYTALIKNLASRLQAIPQRLAKPQCGQYMQYVSGPGTLLDNVRLGYSKYIRLHPNYFFTSGSPTINVRSMKNIPLTVCYSRTNPTPSGTVDQGSGNNPQNPRFPQQPQQPRQPQQPQQPQSPWSRPQQPQEPQSPWGQPQPNPRQPSDAYGNRWMGRLQADDAKCVVVSSSATSIPFPSSPCDNYDYINRCPPFYLSVSAPLSDNVPEPQCQNCRLPTNVEFEITVTGLSCDSGAAELLINNIVLLLTTFFLICAKFF